MDKGKHLYDGQYCHLCGQPRWTSLKGTLMGLAMCPGVWWIRVGDLNCYPYLATATTLSRLHHKPRDRTHPNACYYSAVREDYIFLYDIREALPKRVPSAKQAAALAKARCAMLRERTCSQCGHLAGTRYQLSSPKAGLGLCGPCLRRFGIEEWARSWFMPEAPPWCIVDTETSGLEPWAHVVEIAVLDPGGTPLLSTRVRPPIPIPVEATAIHGLSDHDVESAPTFAEIYPKLLASVAGKVILAYNADFDKTIIAHACRENGLPSLRKQGVTWVDVMEPYAEWVGDWSSYYQDYRWQPLPRNVGELHSALGDCQAVLTLLHRLADRAVEPQHPLYLHPADEDVPSSIPAASHHSASLPLRHDGHPIAQPAKSSVILPGEQ